MAFKPPGGELTGWSIVWILIGIAAIIVASINGSIGLLVLGACVGLPPIGMWFEQRWCGHVFAGLLMLSIPLGVIALFTIDDTLTERAFRLGRIAMTGYFASLAFRWAQDSA